MRLLDHDPFTGITEYFKHDSETGKNIIMSVQDCEPLVEMNKVRSEKLDRKGNFWYVGTIPNVIMMRWAKECGHKMYSPEWNEYARKQLMSGNYRAFNQNKIKL